MEQHTTSERPDYAEMRTDLNPYVGGVSRVVRQLVDVVERLDTPPSPMVAAIQPAFNPPAKRSEGLYTKFRVERVDGRDLPGGDKANAKYFVLDYANDHPYSRAALIAYADACSAEFPALAADLREAAKVETTPAEPRPHADLIAGMRALADLLEQHPEIPLHPLTEGYVSQRVDTQAEVDRWAALLGVSAGSAMGTNGPGHYRAEWGRGATLCIWTEPEPAAASDVEPVADLEPFTAVAVVELAPKSSIWTCPVCNSYCIKDGPVPDGEPTMEELIAEHMAEHERGEIPLNPLDDDAERPQVADDTAGRADVEAEREPRVWRPGDDEPDDEPHVVDEDGDIWHRDEDGNWAHGDLRPRSWGDLVYGYGPLTESLGDEAPASTVDADAAQILAATRPDQPEVGA